MKWTAHRPVIYALIWLFLIHVLVGLFMQAYINVHVLLVIIGSFVFLSPIPYMLFPLIIVSIKIAKGEKLTSSLHIDVDGRSLVIDSLPVQVKIYCARKNNYDICIYGEGIKEVDLQTATFHEEKTCSKSFIVEKI